MICNVIIEISHEAFKELLESGLGRIELMLGLKEMHWIEVGHF